MKFPLCQQNIRKTRCKNTQSKNPTAVGRANAAAVFFMLPVSFQTVISEVAQGQWNTQKTMQQIPICHVQPACSKISPAARLSPREPAPDRIMMITGISSSLAGNDNKKPARIVPLSPMTAPIGSKYAAISERRSNLPISQRIIPAGAATVNARPPITSVRSTSDRTRICPSRTGFCGNAMKRVYRF